MGNSSKQQVLSKIRFLEDQLVSLDHYLSSVPWSGVTREDQPRLRRG